jgi:hypothetical protein
MVKVLRAEHFTYKFKTSAKLWLRLHQTNNEDDVVAEVVIDYVQDIVESSNDTRFQQIILNVERAISNIYGYFISLYDIFSKITDAY